MYLSNAVLGSTVVNKLKEIHSQALVQIGKDTFTRLHLAQVYCWNFAAAANASKLLTKEFDIKSVQDLFERVSPMDVLKLNRMGALSLNVLAAVMEIKGVGGETPLENWIRRHQGKDAEMFTVHTLKAHEAKREAEEKRRTKTKRRPVPNPYAPRLAERAV